MLSQTYSDWSSILTWPTPSNYEPFDYSAALRPNNYTFSGNIATIDPAELKTSLDGVPQPVQEQEEAAKQEEISIEEPPVVSNEEVSSDTILQLAPVATDFNFLSPNTALVYPRSPELVISSNSPSPLSTPSVLPVSDASDVEPIDVAVVESELVPPPKRPRGRPKKTSTFKIPYATPPPGSPSPSPSSSPKRLLRKPSRNRRKNDDDESDYEPDDDEDYDASEERPRKRARNKEDGHIKCTVKGCSTTFKRYADMRRHWENRHSGRTYKCRLCDEELSRHDARLRHERSVHGKRVQETNSESKKKRKRNL